MTLKFKTLTRLTAKLLAGAGINVTKANGNYTISLDGNYVPSFADALPLSAGDILYAINETTIARLPIGAEGQYLQITGAVPDWADLAIDDAGSITPVTTPGGVITLTSGIPYEESDVTGIGGLFYTPAVHDYIQRYNGTGWVTRQFPELELEFDANAGHTNYHAADRNFDLFFFDNNGTDMIGTGPNWTAGGGSGSSTQRGTGAGSTELEIFQGREVNKNTTIMRYGAASGNTISVPARQARFLGSVRPTSAGVTENSKSKRLISNAFNEKPRFMSVTDPNGGATTWAYSTPTLRQANANAANKVAYLQCVPGRVVEASAFGHVQNSSTTPRICLIEIGLDSTSVGSATHIQHANTAGLSYTPARASYRGCPGLGYHELVWLEQGSSAGGDTQNWLGLDTSSPKLWKSGLEATVYG